MTEKTEPRWWLAKIDGSDVPLYGPDPDGRHIDVRTGIGWRGAPELLHPAVVVPEKPTDEEVERVAAACVRHWEGPHCRVYGSDRDGARAAIAAMRGHS